MSKSKVFILAAAFFVICATAYAAEAEIEEQPEQDSSKTEVASGTNDKLATAEGRYYGYGGHGHGGGYGGHGGKIEFLPAVENILLYSNQTVSRVTNIFTWGAWYVKQNTQYNSSETF